MLTKILNKVEDLYYSLPPFVAYIIMILTTIMIFAIISWIFGIKGENNSGNSWIDFWHR